MLRSIHKAESARGVNCPRIHDTEVLLDNVSYSSVINAWPHAKEPSKAEEWLATMLKVEVSANVISYSSVINAWAQANKPLKAQEWLAEMRSAGLPSDVV